MSTSGVLSDEDRHALYDAGVFFIDQRAVGPIVSILEQEGLADETLLVITSDHGEELFEHGKFSPSILRPAAG